MSGRDDHLVEGRTRRSRAVITVGAMVLLVAALPLAYARLVGGDDEPTSAVVPEVESPSPRPADETMASTHGLHGRLVFTTFEATGPPDRQQQIWVLDLGSGGLTEGPLVPAVEELWVADRERGWLVLVTADRDAQGVAYLLTALPTTAEPVELARGDLLSLSADGRDLLVGRSEPIGPARPGCQDHRFELSMVSVESGATSTLVDGSLACGNLVAATPLDGSALVSVVVDGRPEVWQLWPDDYDLVFGGLAYLSRSARGTLLLVDPEGGVPKGLGVWPRTPTGPLLVWPGAGSPRPLVDGTRLYAQRIVGWSPDGGWVVVGGIVGDQRSLWLVYVPAGTMEPLLPPNSFPLRSGFSGAAFDDRGTVFAAAPGTLVARTDAGIVPIDLPPDAPSPVGPVAWLP